MCHLVAFGTLVRVNEVMVNVHVLHDRPASRSAEQPIKDRKWMESACEYLTAAFAPAFTSCRFEESKSALKVYLETCMHVESELDHGGFLLHGRGRKA